MPKLEQMPMAVPDKKDSDASERAKKKNQAAPASMKKPLALSFTPQDIEDWVKAGILQEGTPVDAAELTWGDFVIGPEESPADAARRLKQYKKEKRGAGEKSESRAEPDREEIDGVERLKKVRGKLEKELEKGAPQGVMHEMVDAGILIPEADGRERKKSNDEEWFRVYEKKTESLGDYMQERRNLFLQKSVNLTESKKAELRMRMAEAEAEKRLDYLKRLEGIQHGGEVAVDDGVVEHARKLHEAATRELNKAVDAWKDAKDAKDSVLAGIKYNFKRLIGRY